MYEETLRQMQRAVQTGRIRFTSHAYDELRAESLGTDDALNCVLTGEIVSDQYDPRYSQVKYIIFGDTLAGGEMGLVARWAEKQSVVVITAYRLKIDDYE